MTDISGKMPGQDTGPDNTQDSVESGFPRDYNIEGGDENNSISLPSATIAEIENYLNTLTDDDVSADKLERIKEWLVTLSDGVETSITNDVFHDALNNEGRPFSNDVSYRGKSLNPASLSVSKTDRTATTAMDRILEKTVGRKPYTFAAWHSGIHITIAMPTESEIIELHRTLADAKINIGRSTHGLVFSNMEVIIANELMSFIESKVISTTLAPGHRLVDVILSTDLQLMAWGLVASIYSNGFSHSRSCMSPVSKGCNATFTGKINPKRMLVTDRSRLTDVQLAHMADTTPGSKTLESVLEYQAAMKTGSKSEVTIEAPLGDINIKLKIPTMREYIARGMHWVNSIENIVTETHSNSDTTGVTDGDDETISANKVEAIATQHLRATAMCQYTHWVEEISISDEKVTDPDQIREMLAMYSAYNNLSDSFINSVSKYISEQTISMPAMSAFECPECGHLHSDDPDKDSDRHNIIALNAVAIFFILTVMESYRIYNSNNTATL